MLPLDDNAIQEALNLHDKIFLRSHEILRHLTVERASFESFSSWLILMAEDVLAHEDTNVESPPLHTIDTVKVAEYISQTFLKPILQEFSSDLTLDKSAAEGYLFQVDRLAETMGRYFRSAARELREGIHWVLPDWIDLQFDGDEIVASHAQITVQVWPLVFQI
jgi:hypothetical protein